MLQWISWVIGLPLGRLLGGQRGDYGQGFRTRGFAKRRVIVAHAWDVRSAGSVPEGAYSWLSLESVYCTASEEGGERQTLSPYLGVFLVCVGPHASQD